MSWKIPRLLGRLEWALLLGRERGWGRVDQKDEMVNVKAPRPSLSNLFDDALVRRQHVSNLSEDVKMSQT
jgi:hypothetical protein